METIRALIRNNPILNPQSLPLIARYTFKRHLWAWTFNMIFMNGLIWPLYDIIPKRALDASDIQITILTMIMPVMSLFTIHWASVMMGRNKRPFFVLGGILGRLILVLMLFCYSANFYLILLAVMFFFNSLIIPAQNNIFQNNYPAHLRGQLFGTAVAVSTLVTMPFAYFAGRLLEYDQSLFRFLFVIAGISGFIGIIIFSRIRIRHRPPEKGAICSLPARTVYYDRAVITRLILGLFRFLLLPIRETVDLFRRHRIFMLFEGCFMLYGIGFMLVLPAIPIWLSDVVFMPYDRISVARTVIGGICLILFSAAMGKLMDRMNPIRFCALIFAVLAFYPVFILLFRTPNGVYLAFLAFGIGMVGLNIAWNLSSIYFAGDEEVSPFMGAHVTLVGVRGLFAPFLGYLILKYVSLSAVFAVSASLFVIASLLMVLLSRSKTSTFSQAA